MKNLKLADLNLVDGLSIMRDERYGHILLDRQVQVFSQTYVDEIQHNWRHHSYANVWSIGKELPSKRKSGKENDPYAVAVL